MANSTINIGVIGCGQIAQSIHMKILARLPGVRISAVAEADAGNRTRAGNLAPGAKVFGNANELLQAADVDAVLIALPSALHAQTAIAAFGAGKHVYLEKPVATCDEDGARVIDAWRAAKTVGVIGFNYRFNSLIQQAKAIVTSGTLGKLLCIRMVFSCVAGPLPEWKKNRATGGGVLLDLASHQVDLLHYLTGQPVEEVFARTLAVRCAGDTATVNLRLGDGTLVECYSSLSGVDDLTIDLYGERAMLHVDRHRGWSPELIDPASQRSRFGGVQRGLRRIGSVGYALQKRLAVGHEPSYQAAMEYFVRAIRGEMVDYPNLEDGYRSLRIIEAAEESVASGESVGLQPTSMISADA